MPVLRVIAPFRSSSTLKKKQINARKYASFAWHLLFRSSFTLQKKQIKARKCVSFTRHLTIQIVFHPARKKINFIFMLHYSNSEFGSGWIRIGYGSWIRIRGRRKSWIRSALKKKNQEISRLNMDAKMEDVGFCRLVVADTHHLDEEQDQDPN